MTQGEGQAAGVGGVAPAVGAATHGAVLQSILLNQQRSNSAQALMQVQLDNGFLLQAAAAVVAAPGVVGAAHGAVLQSILLNQQRCVNQQTIQQVQMETGFSSLKQCIDRWFVTLNDNVRRFGGTMQGGFARQDPTQAANRQAARNEPPLPQPPNLPVGATHRDPTAELAPNLHTLKEMWTEWKFGIGGRKPAQLFSRRERGGHGSGSKKMKFCRRLKIYLLLQKLVDEGRTSAEAIAAVKLAYGAAKSVTQFSEAIRLIPNHPSLNPPPRRRKE